MYGRAPCATLLTMGTGRSESDRRRYRVGRFACSTRGPQVGLDTELGGPGFLALDLPLDSLARVQIDSESLDGTPNRMAGASRSAVIATWCTPSDWSSQRKKARTRSSMTACDMTAIAMWPRTQAAKVKFAGREFFFEPEKIHESVQKRGQKGVQH